MKKTRTRTLALAPDRAHRYDPNDDRYEEVTNEIRKKLKSQQFDAGTLLQQASEEKLFGTWGNFKSYVEGEFRITEKSAYRLIFAAKTLELLMMNGCKTLPVNERQIRPLASLKLEREQVLAWNRACAGKQKSSPTHIDVQREVNRLLDPRDNASDENFRQYCGHLRTMECALKRASTLLADGDLEAFLIDSGTKPQRQKARAGSLLLRLGTELGDHFRVFEPYR